MQEKSQSTIVKENIEHNYLVYYLLDSVAEKLTFSSTVPLNEPTLDNFFLEKDEQLLFNEAYSVIRLVKNGKVLIQRIVKI